jgi:hypothetical protein
MPEDDDEALELYWDEIQLARSRNRPEIPTVTEPRPPTAAPGDLVIGTSRDRILVTIKPTGELIFGPEYHPMEAARVFWEHMGQQRLAMEERLILIQHMEAILVQLGRADMICENLRRRAAEELDETRKRELITASETAMGRLNMVAHQAIELGRGLVARPDIPVPAVPVRVPTALQENPNTEYQGREGLPPEEDLV